MDNLVTIQPSRDEQVVDHTTSQTDTGPSTIVLADDLSNEFGRFRGVWREGNAEGESVALRVEPLEGNSGLSVRVWGSNLSIGIGGYRMSEYSFLGFVNGIKLTKEHRSGEQGLIEPHFPTIVK